jgi:hypothetical protein
MRASPDAGYRLIGEDSETDCGANDFDPFQTAPTLAWLRPRQPFGTLRCAANLPCLTRGEVDALDFPHTM